MKCTLYDPLTKSPELKIIDINNRNKLMQLLEDKLMQITDSNFAFNSKLGMFDTRHYDRC